MTQLIASASTPATETRLDRPARLALVGDGVLAIVLGTSGLVTASSQAEFTGLPVLLLILSSVALLPYGVRALQAGRGSTTSRARAEGLVLFNTVWLVVLVGLVFGGWMQPTAIGVAVLVGNAVIPAVVAALTWRSLSRQ